MYKDDINKFPLKGEMNGILFHILLIIFLLPGQEYQENSPRISKYHLATGSRLLTTVIVYIGFSAKKNQLVNVLAGPGGTLKIYHCAQPFRVHIRFGVL